MVTPSMRQTVDVWLRRLKLRTSPVTPAPVEPVPTIGLPDHYYILGDGHLYARHLFRRDGAHVTLVAIVLDADAAEKILQALSG